LSLGVNMAIVQAVQSFEHNGPRKRGARFHASESAAVRLRDAGLVLIVGAEKGAAPKGNPRSAAGNPLSASPAARASRKLMSSESVPGEKKPRPKKRAASSL
jgi:hypothetical protein